MILSLSLWRLLADEESILCVNVMISRRGAWSPTLAGHSYQAPRYGPAQVLETGSEGQGCFEEKEI